LEKGISLPTKVSPLTGVKPTLPDLTGKRATRWQDVRPAVLPSSLDVLHGPVEGIVSLPIHLDWSSDPSYDLSSLPNKKSFYATVLREASRDEDFGYLNKEQLVELWPTLRIPHWIRDAWNKQFPELAACSQP